jgi:hypothetical protein
MTGDQHPSTWRATLIFVALALVVTVVCLFCPGVWR